MCGIAGFYSDKQPSPAAAIRAMCDEIHHRGPDDEGFHLDRACAIGMRRLSIIDLSGGHQPISNEDGSIWIVFNGEVYNYQELRERLIGQGHQFRTNSDTETLVHLYEQEGVDGLCRLRGMFAFCIWDANKQQLLLVRDRFGKKPLYYTQTQDGFYFGSELKCLRAAGIPLEPDPTSLRWYFRFTYIPDPYSPYKGVKKLPPGSWLRLSAGGRLEQGRYWKLPPPTDSEPVGWDPEKACAEIVRVFDESVKMRMIADVPLGAFLSGGIDSSLIVASMARQSPDPVKTFSIGFEESEFNELSYAKLIAQKYGTDHHEIIVRPNTVELINKLVWHFDEPFGDTAAIPTYLVSEAAVQHVKVALSGDGGDELFGGYESFQAVQRLRRFDVIPGFVRTGMSWTASKLPYKTRGKNYLRMISRPTELDRYFEYNYSPRFLRERLLQPDWLVGDSISELQREFPDCLLPVGADAVSQAMYFEATANLTGDMLVKVDRMSMAASLEVRCPLLDHELAELAMSIPNSWKMREGRGKYILVKALGDRLPPELLQRGKMGFSFPLAIWFRSTLRDFLWDHLTSSQFLERGIVSEKFVRHLLEEHDSGRRDNHQWLWSLLVLELWFRQSAGAKPVSPQTVCRA